VWAKAYPRGVEATAPRLRSVDPGHALLELDPDLGQLLTTERREAAERELRVRVTTFEVGEWDGGRLADADPTHLGLLVVEGVLAREVRLEDTVSTELLGPGDVLRPWRIEGQPELLPLTVRWNALSTVRLALIDRRTATLLGRYPEVSAVIVDRLSERAQRLSVSQAISQLNRVDRRLLALFWHLAERWGRVASDGIAVPLVLSHRLLGELVGARRPTISAALSELARAGQLVRRQDGTWLVTGEPVSLSAEAGVEVIRQRRRLMPTVEEPTPVAEPPVVAPTDERAIALQTSLRLLRVTSEQRRRDFEELVSETKELRARTLELRARRIEHLQRLRDAARAPESG
jgi:CRP/FNR family transcriptional regulator, cyclic AMP receptor protein